MAELHLSEAEVAKDFGDVLEKVIRQGVDVVVEYNRQPIAVLRAPRGYGNIRHFRLIPGLTVQEF